jgi:hypothetical protein
VSEFVEAMVVAARALAQAHPGLLRATHAHRKEAFHREGTFGSECQYGAHGTRRQRNVTRVTVLGQSAVCNALNQAYVAPTERQTFTSALRRRDGDDAQRLEAGCA